MAVVSSAVAAFAASLAAQWGWRKRRRFGCLLAPALLLTATLWGVFPGVCPAQTSIDLPAQTMLESGSTANAKLIVAAYSTQPEQVYGGEAFTLSLTLQNTGDVSIKNITVTISGSNGVASVILPAQDSGNTFSVKSIAAGAKATQTVALRVRPDAPEQNQALSVRLAYQTGDGQAFTTGEELVIPVEQRMRLEALSPVWQPAAPAVGDAVFVTVPLINKGRGFAYNVELQLKVSGLTMAENCFVGNLGPGTQYEAGFGVTLQQVGALAGNLVVLCEDAYGEAQSWELPVSLTVAAAAASQAPTAAQPSRWTLPWLWLLVAAGAAVGLLLLLLRRLRLGKQRRKRVRR